MQKSKLKKGLHLKRSARKLFLIMKIVMVLLTIACLQAAATGYSQKTITLNLKDASISEIITNIQQQTSFRFVYHNKLKLKKSRINISVVDASLDYVMQSILRNSGYSYTVLNDNLVAVKAAEKQWRLITGTVTNAIGEALTGASVQVKDETVGTTTDANGHFSLDVPEGAVIVISAVGYHKREITIGNENNISVVLEVIENKLDEVVIVGYGSNIRKNLLQSVSTLNADKVKEIPAGSIAQTLAGRLPGLFVTQSGGKPGRQSSIRVRAYDGFGGAKPPLYVVDGIIVDQFAFEGLDASEVQDISVLKDGASAAVYGVRGANGVILVTTKKGKAGPPKLNFISSYSIDEATKVPEMLSAYDEAVYQNDYRRLVTNPTNYQTQAGYYADDELEYWKTHSVNLLDQYFRKPLEWRNTLNISGGSERINYFVSGSFYKGSAAFDNFDYTRYNMRAKVEAQITKDLSLLVNFNSDIRNDQKPYWEYDYDGDDISNLYQGLLTRGAMAPDYITVDGKSYPVGNFMKWHPGEVVNGNTGYNRKKWSNYQALADLTYKVPFVNGLKLRGTFASYTRHTFVKQLNLPYTLYWFKSTGSKNHLVTNELDPVRGTFIRDDGNSLTESYAPESFYQLNLFATYEKAIGKHDVSAMVGYEQSETDNHNFSARNRFILNPSLDQLSLGSSNPLDYGLGGGQFQDGRLAGVGRLQYNYAGTYLIDLEGRYEGSRYFIPSNRYSFFPSVSIGWRISNEKFLEDLTFVNDLKLRASLGFTGEEPRFNPDGSVNNTLQWDQLYRRVGGAVFDAVTDGLVIGTLPNEDITWAKKRSIEYGIDGVLFNNQLNFTANTYTTKRTDILGARTQSLPSTFGATLPLVNYGIVESRGFEFEIGYRKAVSPMLSLFGSINYAFATNKQVLIDENTNIRPYQSQLGRVTGSLFGYVATGILRTQADIDALPDGYTIFGASPKLGSINYRDIRGATSDAPDGKIDANDQEFIGKYTAPPSSYGLTLGATWKSFTIDLLVQGVGRYYKFRNPLNNAQWGGQEAGSAAFWKDHWTPENTDAAYPLYGNSNAPGAPASVANSTFWMDNASFIRLKNLNIGYALPQRIIANTSFKEVRLFFNGANLFLLKDKIKWYDPEGSLTGYPINKNYTFGLNVTL